MLKLKSFSDESVYYEIDRESKTCSCQSFKKEGHCKHLEAIGVYKDKNWSQSKHPTFSQALSGMVKAIRIRSIEDAVYWLHYLDSFKVRDKGSRFRVARRLLIGSAEDGMSIAVMEKTAAKFPHLCQEDTHIIELAAEIVRICRVSNWWHPDTNGQAYIHESLVAYRQRELYHVAEDLPLRAKLKGLEEGVAQQDVRKALLMFDSLMGHKGFSRAGLCDELRIIADKAHCKQAQRILQIHHHYKSPLSGDANFLGQALWWLVGGGFTVGDEIHKVMSGEVREYLQQARERWQSPMPIPAWCCDGIHCGGTDRRYAGMVQDMDALGRCYNHYGNVSPSNVWLPEFYSLEGLEIDYGNE